MKIAEYRALPSSTRRHGENTETQVELPGIKHVSHANRGKEFEKLLAKTHHYYAVKKLAFVQQNPVEWRYVSKSQYDTFRDSTYDFVAKTNRGLYLKKFKSTVDFSGVIKGGKMAIFDSKQITGKSLPLGNIPDHQIKTLRQSEECGAISGILLMFSDLNRVFFLSATVIERACVEMLYKNGRKSISLANCESEGVEIPVAGGLVEWLTILG